MSTCLTSNCCPYAGNFENCNDNCDYLVNGVVKLYLIRKCDLASVANYEDNFAGSLQAEDAIQFPTGYGNPLIPCLDNIPCALYQENAVSDIILKNGATAWNIGFVETSATFTDELQGGGEPTASKYLLSSLTFTTRGVNQYLKNRSDELNNGQFILIIVSSIPNKKYALEVNNLLGVTTPPIYENRAIIVGHNGLGFKVTENTFNLGGGPDELAGYTITMTSEGSGFQEILPFIDSDYNDPVGTGTAAGYIAGDFAGSKTPYCNLFTTLTTCPESGDGG